MIVKTSAEARRQWREVLDTAQKEPGAITRRGLIIAYVISAQMMDEFVKMRTEFQRR
jgi:prevent-host-death family protein